MQDVYEAGGDVRLRPCAAILDQMPIGVAIARAPDGALLFQNRHADGILGHGRRPAAGIEDYVAYGAIDRSGAPIPPDRHPLARALLAGETIDRELLLYRRPEGDVRDLEVSATLVRGADAAPLYAVATFVDVTERRAADRARAESEARLAKVLEATTDSVFVVDRDWRIVFLNERARAQIARGGALLGDVLWRAFPEAVGTAFWTGYREAMATGRSVRVEEHFAPLGMTFEAHAHPFDDGIAVFFRDVTRQREIEAARDAMAREMAHRVGNLFTLVNSMVGMTARSTDTAAEMAEVLSGRIMALAAAHQLVRPGEGATAAPTTLAALVRAILAPYEGSSATISVDVDAPGLTLGPDAATAAALILHEFATNAAKYGALADDDGRLELRARVEAGTLLLEWRETVSRPLAAPGEVGFGSTLVRAAARGRLGGEIDVDWRTHGMTARLRADVARCAR